MESLKNLIARAEENELQALVAQDLDSDEMMRYFQQILVGEARNRLQDLQTMQRLRLLAILFLGTEEQNDFVEKVKATGKTDERSLANLVYQLGGRRFVPDFLLDAVLADSSEAEFVREQAMQLCQFFGQLRECKIPSDFVTKSNFESHAKGADVVAHRESYGAISFLLRDAQNIMLQLLRTVPVGCEMVQQLPVFLRTNSLTALQAFGRLDNLRPIGVHVKKIEVVDHWVEIQITTWHDKFPVLPLRDFQVRRMKLVKKSSSGLEKSEHSAFPVSLCEWTFYAPSFEQDHFDIPTGLQRHAIALDPAECDPPSTLPFGDELPLLRVNFSHLSYAFWQKFMQDAFSKLQTSCDHIFWSLTSRRKAEFVKPIPECSGVHSFQMATHQPV